MQAWRMPGRSALLHHLMTTRNTSAGTPAADTAIMNASSNPLRPANELIHWVMV
jgi:hypothetical protein